MDYFSQLKKRAIKAQEKIIQGRNYISWNDMDDGNFLIFDIQTTEAFYEVGNDGREYLKGDTTAFALFDIDSNLLRIHDGDEENKFLLPMSDYLMSHIEDARDEGNTVAFWTGHVFHKDYHAKKSGRKFSFHSIEDQYGDDDSDIAKCLDETIEKYRAGELRLQRPQEKVEGTQDRKESRHEKRDRDAHEKIVHRRRRTREQRRAR